MNRPYGCICSSGIRVVEAPTPTGVLLCVEEYREEQAPPLPVCCVSGIRVVGAPTPTGVKEILNFSNKHRIFGDLADTVLLIARYDFFLTLFKLTFEIFGDLQRKYG